MKRSISLSIIAAIILLAVAFLLIIGLQEQRLQSLSRSAFVAEVRSWLPLMQTLINADNLAAIKLLNGLRLHGRLDRKTIDLTASTVRESFGDEVRYLIADPDLKVFADSGFSQDEKAGWLQFMHIYKMMNMYGRQVIPDNIREMLTANLGTAFNAIYIYNYLMVYQGYFADRAGLILFGSRMADQMPKNVMSRFNRDPLKEPFEKNLCGHYLIFIPETAYANLEWYRRNQRLMLSSASNVFTGSLAELQKMLVQTGFSAAAEQLVVEAAARPNGIFAVAGQVFSFCTNKLNEKTAADKLYTVIVTDIPGDKSVVNSDILKGIIIISLLLIVVLCLNNLENQRWFSLSISWHFAWLAAAACLLPILALLFQAFSQVQVQAFKNRSDAFDRLEDRITSLERDYQKRLSEMFLTLQLFHERCVAGEKPIEELCEESIPMLRQHSIREFYVCDRNSDIQLYRISSPQQENLDRAKEGARLMRLLVQFIQHNVKFVSEGARMSVGDGLIIESVAEVIGRESLYHYALQHNRLLTFKALHGAIWLVNFFQYDENGVPVKFFVYAVSRAPYQERMVESWVNSCATGTPQLLLANQNTSYREILTPVWLENRPEFSRLLRHLNFAGGGFKSEYSEAGQNFLIAGRSLDDIDWSVIALENMDDNGQGLSRTAVLLFAAIAFLVIIITVISRYFASIFLLPVRQLSSSVAAMAEGNYDLRLDVTTDDEIGQLCHNFNSMAAGLKEKEYLNRFLSDIAREAISGRVSPRATRVEGAVLFSDIRNFTTMTEQKEPEEIVQMLNEFMTEAETVVVKHGGTIEKFIGDAIMVVFLPALGSAAPTVRAVRAAEELLAAISLMNDRREKQGLFTINIGAGIATGSLLMGTIGNQQGRRDYSVTGKTVLRAAAMEKFTRQVTGKKIVICPSSAEIAATAEIRVRKLSLADSEDGYEVL
ncbi:MAG: hypothetical protein GQF41_1369 [Candidatus Rifleibacterium amylolyticum]|nr:MAG: hypothetical protein GQF41_1369 [Candidatus Rifleibacterium amylolyticum]